MSEIKQPYCVIGLHAAFAAADNIDRFERFIYQGKASFAADKPLKSLQQACLDSVEVLARQIKTSAEKLDVILLGKSPTKKLTEALTQAFASFVCVESLAQALILAQGKDCVAIVGSQAQSNDKSASATLSFDAEFSLYAKNAGEAALLLATEDYCRQHKLYTYARILSFAADQDVAFASQNALENAGLSSDKISYLEVSALANKTLRQQELEGILFSYKADKSLHTAVGGVRSVIGEGGAFAEVAGFVKTVLVLHQRYYPATADWQKPHSSEWYSSVFYFPVESVPCYSGARGQLTHAAYSCQSENDYCHIILQENQQAARSNGYFAHSDCVLLPVSANSEKALIKQLHDLKKSTKPLRELALMHYQSWQQQDYSYTVCLLAESHSELLKEIDLAERGISEAFATATEWKTPKGSFFSAQPIGQQGISFLYPGIGATYVGLGRELFHLFPEIYPTIAALADDIGESLKDTILNPRSIDRLGFHDLKAIDHQLRNKLADIAECGVGFSCIFTKIFEDVFQLKADFATGYSMGEISMFAALGCWKKPGQMSKRLAQSDTFNHRLSGELQSLRQHWNLPPAKQGDIQLLWETYTLKATIEEINEAAADEDKVYCTIINTPDSLVIGGDPAACQRVIKRLGVRAMALDMPNAIHSPPAFMEYQHMEALYTMDVDKRLDTKLYSSSCYLPVPQRTKAIANSIAKCLCDPVDFPRLINTMYDKGARIFLEMGPGRSLSSWVEKTLKHENKLDHLCVPVNAKGTSDELTILRAVAKLVSHGVPLHIERLYYGSVIEQ